MEHFIEKHLKKFSRTFAESTVVNCGGTELSLATGIRVAVDMVVAARAVGNSLYFIGNGGSASITSHMSVDFWKTAGIKSLAFTDPSLLTCISNDCGYPQVFQKPIEMFLNEGDILVAISSSGKSENILNGAVAAKAKVGKVITMSGFDHDNPLSKLGDINFYSPASHYGIVEVCHQLLCHCILDTLTEGDNG